MSVGSKDREDTGGWAEALAIPDSVTRSMTMTTTILMCAQKLTDASLIYRTLPKTKTSKMKKLKNKRICSEETVPGKNPWSQSGRGKKV